MKLKLVFVLLGCLLLSCNSELKTDASDLAYLPKNAATIIKVNQFEEFKEALNTNSFLDNSSYLTLYHSIKENINGLDYIKPDASCILGFYEVGKNNFEPLLIADNKPGFFDLEKAKNKSDQTLNYENKIIKKYVLDANELYSTLIDEKIVVSTSQMLVENVLRNENNIPTPITLQKLFEKSSRLKPATFFINPIKAEALINTKLKPEVEVDIASFSDWISVDFASDKRNFVLSGVTMANDSIKNFMNLFKGSSPLKVQTATIAPRSSKAILAYTYNDYEAFLQQQQTYLDRILPEENTVFNTIEEVGIIYTNNSKAVVLNSFGGDNLTEVIKKYKTGTSLYQSNEIINLNEPKFLTAGLAPLISNFKSNHCTVLENAYVFTSDVGTMHNILANYKGGTTFKNAPEFKTISASLPNESTVLFVAGANGMEHFLKKDFSKTLADDFKAADFKDHAFALQLVSDGNFYHTHLLVMQTGTEIRTKGTSAAPILTVKLDANVASNPQFVTNHYTKQKEIAVQDANNVLYLISGEGKVLWKKQLDAQIVGKIHQVDILKNNKLQLAFCTDNQFLIIDRKGRIVNKFKKTFEGGNLNELAIFDYDGKKDYRFVITQGEKVFMFDRKAEIVSGFKYTNAKSNIINAPKHFRVDNKDYLVFQLEDGTLKIQHRTGKDRIQVKNKINFSDNEVFLYRNKFSVTDTKGVLHQTDINGKTTTINLSLNKDHGVYTTSKTLVFMNDNVLSIKGKKVELDFGVYETPKIFYLYDKIYVAVTDVQNKKVHLYDSQARSIQGFPAHGGSLIDLSDIDNDKKIDVVTKDQNNTIVVYELN